MILQLCACLVVLRMSRAVIISEVNSASLDSSQGFKLTGVASGDGTGRSVSNAGDVNGDGIADLIVGAYTATPPAVGQITRVQGGIVHVVFGRRTYNARLTAFQLTGYNTSTEGSFRILGSSSDGLFGHTVASAGDVNGDGIDDLIAGEFNAIGATGTACVIFGRNIPLGAPKFTDIDLMTFAASKLLGFRIFGAAAGDCAGVSVTAAGDLNRDGVRDMIIGAYGANSAYIIYGRNVSGSALPFANINLQTLNSAGSTVGYRVISATPGDIAGICVSGAGDINGDGLDDILVGARDASPVVNGISRPQAGITYVIFGTGAATRANIYLASFSTSRTMGFRVLGAFAVDNSALSVSAAGDVNGDGIGDIIIGALGSNVDIGSTTRVDAGISYVIFGRNVTTSAPAFVDIDLRTFNVTSLCGFRILGAAAGDNSGCSVSEAGDVNADGIDDIIVGAASLAYVIYGRKVGIFQDVDLGTFAGSSTAGFRIVGAVAGSGMGSSVSTAGDINQDGITDVVVGAPNNGAGAAYVIFGVSDTPTSQPSTQPSSQPSTRPTRQPSAQPSKQPAGRPSAQPSSQPSSQPFTQPSSQPTHAPSAQPSTLPSVQPSIQPTSRPSRQPSAQPTATPSAQPTSRPSEQPTRRPTGVPSVQPTVQPSTMPTNQPTTQPSTQPSAQPSARPSLQPSEHPSAQPTSQPSTQPSAMPSFTPSGRPSCQPTSRPSTQPSICPRAQPTHCPSSAPTTKPSASPSMQPLSHPSAAPSVVPSSQPTGLPSVQPSAEPSGRPSAAPSFLPSTQPSAVPTALPSARPTTSSSSQPSTQPTLLPTLTPSVQPTSQPSGIPSVQPSIQPSSLPTSQPSSRPTASPSLQPTATPTQQPSTQPSAQPSLQPRTAPTAQPIASPTARPSLAPTREMVLNLGVVAFAFEIFEAGDNLWMCGQSLGINRASCGLYSTETGAVGTQYTFDWERVVAVMTTTKVNSVTMCGWHTDADSLVRNSDISVCSSETRALQCAVTSYHDSAFLAVSYVPYPDKIVSVGWYNAYTSITILDATLSTIQSYMYAAANTRALTLSHVRSPPHFVGAFVAGMAVRATAAPVNYIVAGMVRTEAGIMKAMVLMPQSGDIRNHDDLVTAMALESTGPDSFIAGALQISDEGGGKYAYLLRANALLMAIQYCVRYVDKFNGRRALITSTNTSHSVVKAVVLVDSVLFTIVDCVVDNVTSLTVLKLGATNGAILKQVHVFATNASLVCTDIVSVDALLYIACDVHHNASQLYSVLIAADLELSLAALPPGFERSEDELYQVESVPFKRTVLTITKTDTTIATSRYQFSTAGAGSTRAPSHAPSHAPSGQPSSAPSSQPSSSPTAAPSLSARPTSQPSSAVPTNSHKPTAEPTVAPTRLPSAPPTPRPSFRPTLVPSLQPTVPPSTPPTRGPTPTPTALPTIMPVASPSARPAAVPTTRPTRTAYTTVPSASPSAVENAAARDSRRNMPPYVTGASIGGGVGLLLAVYLLYKYYQHDQEAKAREVRKVEFFAKQALLVEQARADTAKYIQEENDRIAAIKLDKELRKAERRAAAQNRQRGGAYATGPVQSQFDLNMPLLAHITPSASSDAASSIVISSLHSSEMGSYYSDEIGVQSSAVYSCNGSAAEESTCSDYNDDRPGPDDTPSGDEAEEEDWTETHSEDTDRPSLNFEDEESIVDNSRDGNV